MPKHNAAAKWETRVNELLTTVEVIQDPDDASPQGQFEKILDSFLTGKVKPDKRMRSWMVSRGMALMRTKFILDLEDLFIFL